MRVEAFIGGAKMEEAKRRRGWLRGSVKLRRKHATLRAFHPSKLSVGDNARLPRRAANDKLAVTDNTASMSFTQGGRMPSRRKVSQAPVLARSSSPEPRDIQKQGTRGRIDARAAHTIAKLQKAGISNAGSLAFKNTDKKPAKFAKMPDMKDKAGVDKAIDVLTDVWKLPRANVLISVTGGAQVFS